MNLSSQKADSIFMKIKTTLSKLLSIAEGDTPGNRSDMMLWKRGASSARNRGRLAFFSEWIRMLLSCSLMPWQPDTIKFKTNDGVFVLVSIKRFVRKISNLKINFAELFRKKYGNFNSTNAAFVSIQQ